MAVLTASMPAAFAAPRPPAWVRRAAPVGLALVLHGIALALAINLVRPPVLDPPRRPIQVELVRPAPEPAAVAPPATPVSAAAERAPAEPQQSRLAPAQSSAQPAARISEPSLAAEPPARAAPASPAPAGAVLDAPGGANVETALPTRSSALRGLACARAFGGEGRTLGCGGETRAGYDFARFADGEGAAQVEGLAAARFNALAGLYGARLDPGLRRLPGQQGMQVMQTRRMGMSGADEMRETLPPMVPDPAFGD